MEAKNNVSVGGLPPRSLFRSLGPLVRTVGEMSPCPYLVFANEGYREVLLNWLASAKRVGVSNVVVIAYSRSLYEELHRTGIKSVFVPLAAGKQNLWWRLFVFQAMCLAGIDFIHCDADAVLLRDPGNYLARFPDADFIVSQGTVHPPEEAKSRGFVVCMGFFLLRGTLSALTMLAKALDTIGSTKTDRASVNSVLPTRKIVEEATDWELTQLGYSF